MKTLKISFLFFLFCILLQTNKIYSQSQKIDSLEYYKNISSKTGEGIKALKYFQKKIPDLKYGKDDLLKTEILILIAQIEKREGFFVDSENTIVKALEILPRIKDNDSIVSQRYVSIYNHLGHVYREYEDYNKALLFYDDVISRTNNLEHLTIILNNKGYLYLDKGYYRLAIEAFQKAYTNSLRVNNKLRQARILDNLGVAQSKIRDSSALSNLIKALEIRKEEEYSNGIISSYINLGEYYKGINKISIAKEYVTKASKIADSTKSLIHRQAVLLLKNDLKNDPEYNELKKINDSINSFKKASSVKYAAYKYDKNEAERKANENELKYKNSEIDNQRIKNQNQLVTFLIVLIVLISFFYYLNLKSKHKKKTLQAVYKTESHISKKVHDEVANDIFQVMTTLQSNSNVNESVIDDLDNIYVKTRNISKEHSVLDYEGNFKTTLNDLLLSYNINGVNIAIRDIDKVDWESISKLKKETIYKVLQELMVNMTKHSKAGVVVLNFKPQHKKIQIIYNDDGVGTNLKKSTGLQNMENRIESINGTITFDSEINNGFKAIITV